ncbi:FO synthase subunit 2 [Nitrosopumilaceae archaeon]|nr:5-amino-6-(D-ribitylamino)uracil--L-tyrosine 4-hydroxyphenyl transferase CofH [Nitrosopumilus sp.]CAI9831251.1 FO synthase subunit 2 [Nitrosopumilaceae archaeon]MDA7944660.1 5-amino-6-(D-ribitylamino)uracil--L-tyrosine 4-hydroxyphenyl transferase CofH [Nitrosopumilus sp.]MDA7954581.1 5-amino-6-(D-ribitylamino)uracil--L-tyrosine 4-hydroxyphenyl transferase CofH [Nitrosopumilus sp.]MDA7973340.1 5-amino-6-(D-ribitylamino)uracil--L-tyrosine 4-hydroxyphenyl transferase CofH [Nitrosopumilus sp.]
MALEVSLEGADPAVCRILEGALAGRQVTAEEGAALLAARGRAMYMVGAVADELRRRDAGEEATYVVNRNINFTNVCVKQCGFCAFSRDHRKEEGYMLPAEEVARRAREAQELGATEVCIQAGLPPGMDGDLYEGICRAIKEAAPGIHIHGFSPEEVAYGARAAGVGIEEYLGRLRDAGVGTLPGTSAEILDQGIRDRISPGRLSADGWESIIRAAHGAGIRTTSTMMFGHVEEGIHRTRHIARIRSIQEETGGFTEFVPLGFVHDEAPMYADGRCARAGADGPDVLLTHAVSRIMLHGIIPNIQASWVKEGPALTQLLLWWGANDLGGTLINESISTSAGSGYGQLARPSEMRAMAAQEGRIPAERDTGYNILRRFGGGEGPEALDGADASRFGSYAELVRSGRFRYSR